MGQGQGYPYPGVSQPYYDQFGSAAEFNPYVSRSTAGALAPGQTLISACGRIATATGAITTVPLFTVPATKTWFETDFNLSTIASVEVDCQLQSGAISIDREVTSSTSPINAMHETQPFATGSLVVSLVLPATSGGSINVDFFVAGYFQQTPG
jgi:hypothetical protein